MRNGSKSVTEGSVLLASMTLTPGTSNLIKRYRSMQGTYMPNIKAIGKVLKAL
ncbi:hypothetical protein DPMN_094023 [Dreissena polymorpha]|uniref:Uncharacterized protein n=1 Tax=Dreissena polymorpha TaxID=45954 RepID=A0A9D4L4P2_DREPO|nr:hypothetical protein DPMN_094023 [Dreissena polymorpha]